MALGIFVSASHWTERMALDRARRNGFRKLPRHTTTLLLIAAILMSMQVFAISSDLDELASQKLSPDFKFPETLDELASRKLSPDFKFPQTLLQRQSPLSPVEQQQFYHIIDARSLSVHASEFCTAGNLLCNRSVPFLPLLVFGYGGMCACSTEHIDAMFFPLRDLKRGAQVRLPDLDDPSWKYAFLPRALADKLPFSRNTLSELKQNFHVSEGSNMSKTMDSVMEYCETSHAANDEVGRCVNSVEDMLDFVVSQLGSEVEVLSQPIRSGHEIVRILKVEKKTPPAMGHTLACHSFVFPYAISYCHQQKNSTAFKVWVESFTDGKVTERPVVCHGGINVLADSSVACHFLFGSHISWVPK